MHSSILWFDNGTDAIGKKIERARDYYAKKYGRTPTLVFVHPTHLQDGAPDIDGLTVRGVRTVLPGHIWLGIEDKTS